MRSTHFIARLLVFVVAVTASKVKKQDEETSAGSSAWAWADYYWHDFSYEDTTCSPENVLEKGDVTYHGPDVIPTECGQVSKKRRLMDLLMEIKGQKEERIVGGVESDPNQWPYLVAIGPKNSGQLFGGTLITDRFVLTCAHDFYEQESPCDWNLRFGEHNLKEDEGTSVDREALHIFVHPEYNSTTRANDIALIQLVEPVDTSLPQISTACLPENMDAFPPGTNCYVAGWGTTAFDPTNFPDTVRHVDLTMMYQSQCVEAYGDQIFPGMICAGHNEGGKDACTGDSGGPLVCKVGNRWDVVGVISWGEECALPGQPGVFSSVVHYMDWIQAVVAIYS